MANFKTDSRIVLTLDAGGTNMVFGAMKGGEYIVEPLNLASNSHDLDLCLKTMVDGFQSVIDRLDTKPVAISFAFPGPADYPNGIIGGYLPNFPSFRDGVALGPFLEYKFGIPVFINNDGDLFAYGEALGGAFGIQTASASLDTSVNTTVEGCIAFNTSVKTCVSGGENPADHYSGGAVVGCSSRPNVLKNCWRKSDMAFEYYSEPSLNVLFDHEDSDTSKLLTQPSGSAKWYSPYHGNIPQW